MSGNFFSYFWTPLSHSLDLSVLFVMFWTTPPLLCVTSYMDGPFQEKRDTLTLKENVNEQDDVSRELINGGMRADFR